MHAPGDFEICLAQCCRRGLHGAQPDSGLRMHIDNSPAEFSRAHLQRLPGCSPRWCLHTKGKTAMAVKRLTATSDRPRRQNARASMQGLAMLGPPAYTAPQWLNQFAADPFRAARVALDPAG